MLFKSTLIVSMLLPAVLSVSAFAETETPASESLPTLTSEPNDEAGPTMERACYNGYRLMDAVVDEDLKAAFAERGVEVVLTGPDWGFVYLKSAPEVDQLSVLQELGISSLYYSCTDVEKIPPLDDVRELMIRPPSPAPADRVLPFNRGIDQNRLQERLEAARDEVGSADF